MLSALIKNVHSYPAMPLAGQLAHQRYTHSGPLVLGASPLQVSTPTPDKDQPVSRRSEPSSRNSLIGEQPNPWELLHPQDEMSRHRFISIITNSMDYIFTQLLKVGVGVL